MVDDGTPDDGSDHRPDDYTRKWAEGLLGDLRGERASIMADAEEHGSIAADLRGRAT